MARRSAVLLLALALGIAVPLGCGQSASCGPNAREVGRAETATGGSVNCECDPGYEYDNSRGYCVAAQSPPPPPPQHIIGPKAGTGAFGTTSNPDRPDLGPARDQTPDGTDRNAAHQLEGNAGAGSKAKSSANPASPEEGSGAAQEGFDRSAKAVNPRPLAPTKRRIDTVPPAVRERILKDPNYQQLETEKKEAAARLVSDQTQRDRTQAKLSAAVGQQKQELLIKLKTQQESVDKDKGIIATDNIKQDEIVQRYGAPILKKKTVEVPPPAVQR
jgi:hypothetical protein